MSDFYCEQVLSGKTAVDVVAETANVLAFKHTKPSYKAHIVVIPKRHVASLLDDSLTDTELTEMLSVIKQIAAQIVLEHGAAKIVTNLGDYQESKHLHWHVVCGAIK